jgi:hypothetical protein
VWPTCRACTTASTCTTSRTPMRRRPMRMLTASTPVSRSGRCSWASVTSSDPSSSRSIETAGLTRPFRFASHQRRCRTALHSQD